MLTQEHLKTIIKYNPLTGDLVWIVSKGRSKAGNLAGYLGNLSTRPDSKYRLVQINKKSYLAHRIAFLYMTGRFPSGHIDHINHDGTDNRWKNIREVTSVQNNRNMRIRLDNKTGVCGVKRDRSKWVAVIGDKSKQICLGIFDSLSDAANARKSAEITYGYHENHGTI